MLAQERSDDARTGDLFGGHRDGISFAHGESETFFGGDDAAGRGDGLAIPIVAVIGGDIGTHDLLLRTFAADGAGGFGGFVAHGGVESAIVLREISHADTVMLSAGTDDGQRFLGCLTGRMILGRAAHFHEGRRGKIGVAFRGQRVHGLIDGLRLAGISRATRAHEHASD